MKPKLNFQVLTAVKAHSTVFPKIMSQGINYFDIFRWGDYLKVFEFYVLIMTIFWEKGGIVFKGGLYIREGIIQGNTVCKL